MQRRAEERRKRIVVHIAQSFEDAERWDLQYWQSRTPEDRLSALVAIREDVANVMEGRARDRSLHKGQDVNHDDRA